MMEERRLPRGGSRSGTNMVRRRRDPANARGGGAAAATVAAAASLSLVLALSAAATWKGGGGVGVATVTALNLRGDDGDVDIDIDIDIASNHRDGPAASSAAHRRRRPRSSVRRRRLGGENADEMTNWALTPLYNKPDDDDDDDDDEGSENNDAVEEGLLLPPPPEIIATLPVPDEPVVDNNFFPAVIMIHGDPLEEFVDPPMGGGGSDPMTTTGTEERPDDLLEKPLVRTVPPPTVHLDPMFEFKPLMWWPTQLVDGVKLCVHSNDYPDDHLYELGLGHSFLFPTEIECCSTYDICPIPDGKEVKWYPSYYSAEERTSRSRICAHDADYPIAFLQLRGMLFDTRDDCCDAWPENCQSGGYGSTVAAPHQLGGAASTTAATRSAYWHPSTGPDGARLCVQDDAYPDDYLDSTAVSFLFDDEAACCETYGICDPPSDAATTTSYNYAIHDKPMAWWPVADPAKDGMVPHCVYDNTYPDAYYREPGVALFSTEHECCSAYGICPTMWYPLVHPAAAEATTTSLPMTGSSVTNSPTESPVTSPPTSSPATTWPTQSPQTSSPTHSPVTSTPTGSPVTTSPTHSPQTMSPTHSPVTSTPTGSPVTASPTQSPQTTSPTMSPVTNPPTQSPSTTSPTDSPVTSPPTGSPVTASPTQSPTTTRPTTSPLTNPPSQSPTTTSPTDSPVTGPPTGSPVTASPTSDPCDGCVWHESTKRLSTCTNDPANYPSWWDSRGARSDFFFRTSRDCCDARYPRGCNVEDVYVWHESVDRATTCTNSRSGIPDWWKRPGVREHFFFPSAKACCDARYPRGCKVINVG